MPDLQWYPDLCPIKYELEHHVFVFENCLFSLVVSLQKFLLIKKIGESNTFFEKKKTLSFKFPIRLRYQGYTVVNLAFPSLHGEGHLNLQLQFLSNHLIQFEMIHISYFSIVLLYFVFVEYHLFCIGKICTYYLDIYI